jgi:hypothetical protein
MGNAVFILFLMDIIHSEYKFINPDSKKIMRVGNSIFSKNK